jgi:hypothetical protein
VCLTCDTCDIGLCRIGTLDKGTLRTYPLGRVPTVILVNLETLNFIENPDIALISQTLADYICKSKHITPLQLEHILHLKALSPLQEEMMSHYTRLHHLPFPKLIAMAEAGEIPRRLASLKGCCPICVACLFDTAHKCPWCSKSKESHPI